MPRLPMPRSIPILVGSIVTLRAIDPLRDAADYYDMSLEPDMHTWTGNRVLESVEEARAELKMLAGLDDFTMWAVVDNASGKMMGRFFICLERREDGLVAGEGNRIAKPYWRKGHNRDTRRLVLEYIFNELHADKIETQCWAGNTNSRLSILAHGFTPTKEEIGYSEKHKKEMLICVFQMTRDQWLDLHI